jgi:cytoskeletal protein RodZ
VAEARTRAPSRLPAYVPDDAPQSRYEPEPRELPAFDDQSGNGMGPVRTYGSQRPRPSRRWHLRAAIVTGVIAFAIAAVVLTVPELVFGGAVARHGSTTFFGTSKTSTSKKSSNSDKQSTTPTDKGNTTSTDTNGAPAQQAPQGSTTSTTPQQTPPAQQTPGGGGQAAPQTAPAPSTPPPAQGTP